MNRFTLSLTPESGIGFDLTMRKWGVRPLALLRLAMTRSVAHRQFLI